jgi:murein DD-endopeptidase MepM/ murein hydrolase activator NlpD
MRPISVTALGAALALACGSPYHASFPASFEDFFEPDAPQQREGESAPVAPDGQRYVVQPGDTLYSIARWQHTSVEELASANALADPDRLQVGQHLVMPPGAKPTAARPIHHSPRHAASATPEPAPEEAALLSVDCAILDTDESLRNARFEEALVDARKARSLLRALDSQPGVAQRRAQVETLSAMAEVALGRDDAARASFARALEADPLLALDPDTVSPKILRVFEEARAGPERQARR